MFYAQNKGRTFHPEENPCLPLLSFKIFALKFFIQCHIYKFSPCLCKFLLKHYSFFFCLLPSKWTPRNLIHNAIGLSYANFQLNIPHQIGNIKMQSYKPMLLKWNSCVCILGRGGKPNSAQAHQVLKRILGSCSVTLCLIPTNIQYFRYWYVILALGSC